MSSGTPQSSDSSRGSLPAAARWLESRLRTLLRSRGTSTATSALRDCLNVLLVALILALFVRTFVLQVLEVPGDSMEPGLLAGDRLVIDRMIFAHHGPLSHLLPAREIRRGDLVLFRYPEDLSRSFVKRCLGLPGDEVRIVDKVLYVNGEELDESGYVEHRDPRTYLDSQFLDQEFRRRDHFESTVVSAGQLFCLGDNRDLSNDSRYWGTVPRASVLGRPTLVLWSFDRSKAAELDPPGSAWGKIQRSWNSLGKGIRRDRTLKTVK